MFIILIDIDYFKRFNDSSGYLAGDQCLVAVADAIRSSAKRSMDMVGRYGGDEFIMILPSTDTSAAIGIADKVRSKVLNRSLYYDEYRTDKLSLTRGMASLRGSAIKSPAHLVKLADDALLHGKANGRNTIFNATVDSDSGPATFKCQQPPVSC